MGTIREKIRCDDKPSFKAFKSVTHLKHCTEKVKRVSVIFFLCYDKDKPSAKNFIKKKEDAFNVLWWSPLACCIIRNAVKLDGLCVFSYNYYHYHQLPSSSSLEKRSSGVALIRFILGY